jgi:hypothetical protein
VRVGVVLTRSLSIFGFHFDVRAQFFGELAFLAAPKDEGARPLDNI